MAPTATSYSPVRATAVAQDSGMTAGQNALPASSKYAAARIMNAASADCR